MKKAEETERMSFFYETGENETNYPSKMDSLGKWKPYSCRDAGLLLIARAFLRIFCV
ncbi:MULTISPECIES: hypothetical protein [unclassified Fibrobacter]|uniref:hypothetical protein n=1 Tax=unclassified Fibrobacter TaxID=2634177 RepID=UPI0025BC1BD7|nr:MULTISPECIES: hypothetical protein [unclassified Fibrobacter]